MIEKKEKYLITGISGFVGRHFLQFLYQNKIHAEILGIDLKLPGYDLNEYHEYISVKFESVNLLDMNEIRKVLDKFEPEYILHLASFSSVAYSWQSPAESFSNNTNIFLNLVSVIRERDIKCRILSIGSSEEYGNVAMDAVPIREDQPLDPISPYAAARVSQEILSKIFADSYHMDIIMTRSFNHIGVWQEDKFVIPSFISRIIAIKERGEKSGIIECGDISLIRDFVDVKDVVRAYYMLLHHGRAGEVYNICSGKGHTLKEIIEIIGEIAGVEVNPTPVSEYLRPNDNKMIIGDFTKIRTEIGWEPEILLEETLQEMVHRRI